jgi:hypothetical protein
MLFRDVVGNESGIEANLRGTRPHTHRMVTGRRKKNASVTPQQPQLIGANLLMLAHHPTPATTIDAVNSPPTVRGDPSSWCLCHMNENKEWTTWRNLNLPVPRKSKYTFTFGVYKVASPFSNGLIGLPCRKITGTTVATCAAPWAAG